MTRNSVSIAKIDEDQSSIADLTNNIGIFNFLLSKNPEKEWVNLFYEELNSSNKKNAELLDIKISVNSIILTCIIDKLEEYFYFIKHIVENTNTRYNKYIDEMEEKQRYIDSKKLMLKNRIIALNKKLNLK